MDGDQGSQPRKRRSRFSDAPGLEAPERRPAKVSTADRERSALDPAALAKAAAAKIAQAMPGLAREAPKATGTMATTTATATAAAPLATAAAAGVELSALEQRRRTDLIMKSVQEQMNQLKHLMRKQPNATSTATTFMPAPLLLDDQGRQIDEHGNLVADSTPGPATTHRANRPSGGKTNQNPYLSHRTVDKEDKLDTVDPRLKITKRETRGTKSLTFVKQGTYVKQAEQLRAREAKKMLAGFTSGRNPRGYQKESIVPIDEVDGERQEQQLPPEDMEVLDMDVPVKPDSNTPDCEWWDLDYLPKEMKDATDKFGFIKVAARKENPEIQLEYGEMKAKYCGTLHVIEHPARLNPPTRPDSAPVVVPLMLTAAERKKIRRQNRAEREREKQEQVALGLVPPPKPKVKLSNMMRVLGEQAVADPSAIEREVRQQMAQREKNHEMRNLARKLTPEERREKKLRKIKEDAAGDIHAAVFRVPNLENPQHRFKVDVNAQQYHLTGGVLICNEAGINVIVVEGGRKAIKHYTRLLTKRIRWNETQPGEEDEEESDEEGDDGSSSECVLVWQGIVARRAFNNFRFQECRTTATARKVMEAKHVVHYWDLVQKSMSSE